MIILFTIGFAPYLTQDAFAASEPVTESEHEPEPTPESEPIEIPTGTDVVIPLGTATPGCEATNECYIPYRYTINVGESVTWFNQDSEWHTVTAGTPEDGPNKLFDSGKIESGQTYDVMFDKAGTYPYFDMVHPWAIGEIVVQGSGTSSSDTTPPQVIVPSDMTIDAGTADYVILDYSAKAIDDVDGVIILDLVLYLLLDDWLLLL